MYCREFEIACKDDDELKLVKRVLLEVFAAYEDATKSVVDGLRGQFEDDDAGDYYAMFLESSFRIAKANLAKALKPVLATEMVASQYTLTGWDPTDDGGEA